MNLKVHVGAMFYQKKKILKLHYFCVFETN